MFRQTDIRNNSRGNFSCEIYFSLMTYFTSEEKYLLYYSWKGRRLYCVICNIYSYKEIHLKVNLQLKPKVTFGFSLDYKRVRKGTLFCYEGHSMQQKSFLYPNYMANPVHNLGRLRARWCYGTQICEQLSRYKCHTGFIYFDIDS